MTSPSWDPAQYGRYADERARPFHDLVNRVRTPSPVDVLDLGCGPGTATRTLLDRWPGARVLGLDSSAEMIRAANRLAVPGRLEFQLGDIATWAGSPDSYDVIVSNAALQWVPEHVGLLTGWGDALRPGGTLAFQVPAAGRIPAGEVFHEVARSPRWRDRLGAVVDASGPRSAHPPVRTAEEYLDVLAGAGLQVDAWHTTYLHVLPGPDPVLEWFSGTGLRPYTDALADPAELAEFRRTVAQRLRQVYPPHGYGTVLPFPRIFVVARRT